MTYSEAVLALRHKMILSQVEFAREIGVSYMTIIRWEKGKFNPTLKAKRKLMPLFEKYGIILEDTI